MKPLKVALCSLPFLLIGCSEDPAQQRSSNEHPSYMVTEAFGHMIMTQQFGNNPGITDTLSPEDEFEKDALLFKVTKDTIFGYERDEDTTFLMAIPREATIMGSLPDDSTLYRTMLEDGAGLSNVVFKEYSFEDNSNEITEDSLIMNSDYTVHYTGTYLSSNMDMYLDVDAVLYAERYHGPVPPVEWPKLVKRVSMDDK